MFEPACKGLYHSATFRIPGPRITCQRKKPQLDQIGTARLYEAAGRIIAVPDCRGQAQVLAPGGRNTNGLERTVMACSSLGPAPLLAVVHSDVLGALRIPARTAAVVCPPPILGADQCGCIRSRTYERDASLENTNHHRASAALGLVPLPAPGGVAGLCDGARAFAWVGRRPEREGPSGIYFRRPWSR